MRFYYVIKFADGTFLAKGFPKKSRRTSMIEKTGRIDQARRFNSFVQCAHTCGFLKSDVFGEECEVNLLTDL